MRGTVVHGLSQPALIATVAVVALVCGGAGAWGYDALRKWQAAQDIKREAERLAAEAKTPFGLQRDAVKGVLNDPDSAQFRNARQAKREPGMWCGEVNAKNRLGGMVGFSRYVVVLANPTKNWGEPQVSIEPREGSTDVDARIAFNGRWSIYCE